VRRAQRRWLSLNVSHLTFHHQLAIYNNMKTPIAVTLIVMGALLIMAPPLSDYLSQRNLVAILSRPGITNASLGNTMGDLYHLGCWLTGTAMIGIAVLCSLFCRKKESEP
jgi:hypothetical protein